MAKTKTTIADYRKLDDKALLKELANARAKLQDLKNQLTIGKLKSYHQIKALRRTIAQMETVHNEKILLEAIQHGES